MIVGVGIDLSPVDRMERAIGRHEGRFQEKVFTPDERAYCAARARPAEHYAARFAAKEAVLKAMRVPPGLSWHELEVCSEPQGAPRLVLRGAALRAARALGVTRIHLSLTHAGGQSAALVVLEGDEASAAPPPGATDLGGATGGQP